jgi:epoxyqueuosine reductase
MQLSSTHVRPTNIAQLAKTFGQAIGFDRVGIAPARPLARAQYYKAWLASGHAAGMTYLHRHVELRADPAKLLPGARSIICVALNYRRSPAERRTDGPQGRVAMYAQCPDYHVLMRAMLETLLERLRREAGVQFEARVCVDTAPVLERELACSAGVGWIGKNTCLLDRQLGSYVFLGEALTTLDLPADEPVADGCARCTRCVDACPTGALTAPYNLDASRCISYLTIEHRGNIPATLQPLVGDWVFGCDVCQQVCPYNRKAADVCNSKLPAGGISARLELLELLAIGRGAYRRLLDGTACHRARVPMWRRNAATALGNIDAKGGTAGGAVMAALAQAAGDENALVRSAAEDARRRLYPDTRPAGESLRSM